MGGESSSSILKKGQAIKKDLYERIEKFRTKYQKQFNQIDTKLKQQVYTSSATELVALLQTKKVTSYQLVLIFAERTSTVGIENNYVFDQMFEQALQTAKQYDKARQQNPSKRNWKGQKDNIKQSFPPFFGIPASYKENIQIKGKNSHVGFIIPHQKNLAKKQNGLFAQITIKMGLIPFVRTNVPMSCKTIDTNNNIFGYCKNPWDQKRSCGGSSGGEGGLVGAYCSPIGLGTDIGGSLRIPAEWNGLMTLKPGYRYSRMGNSFYGKITGGTPVKGQLGPITRSVDDIELYMKYMCNEENYQSVPKQIMDPYMNLKPWQSLKGSKQIKKLKIGYIFSLQTTACSPSHKRVVQEAVNILKQEGHQVVEIQMPQFQELYFAMLQMYVADGSTRILNEISFGQPYIKEFKLLDMSTKIPNCFKNSVACIVDKNEPRMAKILRNSLKLSVGDTFSKIYDMQVQLSNIAYHYFIDNGIQAIVMPGFAFPSPNYGNINKLQYCYSYTTSWNVIHYPVGSMPISVVQNDEQFYEDKFNDSITKLINKNMKKSEGMPVGIQIAALPYKDEIIVELMRTIEGRCKFREKYHAKILGKSSQKNT